jgi:hypothetical protein
MNRKLVLAAFGLLTFSSTGCLLPEVDRTADALDRFSAQVEATTHPEKGNLRKLIDHTSGELRGLVKEGKEITADFMLKWAEERKATFEQIRVLNKEVFGDAHVLVGHLQAAGLSVPLQLGNELEGFSEGLRADVPRWLAMTPFGPGRKTLSGYSGLTWTERANGHYQVTFQIKDAPPLNLSVGGGAPIPPSKPPTSSEITFKVPVGLGIRGRFDDRQDKVLGFTLVDADPKKSPKDWTIRYSGWVVLSPRFPIEYSLRVITPGGGAAGEIGYIEQGPAIEELVRSAAGSGGALAERHGAIYRAARTHLPAGTSKVVIPKQATWMLTIKFPDGKSEVLTVGKPRVKHGFGWMTVTPTLTDDAWTLLIDVEPK